MTLDHDLPVLATIQVLSHKLLVPSVPAASWLYREIVVDRAYDLFSTTKFRTIIDGGANIGAAASFFLQSHPMSHVTCFEPDPLSFAFLQANIARNGVAHRVRCVNVAVSDRDGSRTFFSSPAGEGYNLRMSMDPDRLGIAGPRTRVRTVSLVPFLKRNVDLLKLDVEGAEFAVVADLSQHDGFARIANIVIEVHHYPCRMGRLGAILATLEASGYALTLSADAVTGDGSRRCQDILVAGTRLPPGP